MNQRTLTSEQVNRLFCSTTFLRRVETSGKPSADVLLEASDEEVVGWLAEGTRMESQIQSQGKANNGLRGIPAAVAGIGTALASMLVAIVFSPTFREAVGPGTQWQIGGESFRWPAPFLLFMLILSLPSIVAGLVIARISITRLSMYFGVLGIAVGCWWHIHLSVLGASVTRGYAVQDRLVSIERLDGHSLTRWLVNAEYDLLVHGGSVFGIVMLLLPLLSALMAVCTMNYWVRCWRGAGVSDR